MSKRRAEQQDTLCGVPSKRSLVYGPYGENNNNMRRADPPSLLGSRCRKRPYSHSQADDEQESCIDRREPAAPHGDPGDRPALDGVQMAERDLPTRTPSPTQRSTKKRPRHEAGEALPEATTANDNINNSNSDDISYNSFQFWRVPLPAVDLSLLEPADSKTPESRRNPSGKNPAPDAMEM